MTNADVLEYIYNSQGSRWWYVMDLLTDLGLAGLPQSVQSSKHPRISMGAWLAHRRQEGARDGWLVEGDKQASHGDVMRWRVIPEVLL